MNRMDAIKEKLTAAWPEGTVEVIDDSHLHEGHAAAGGAGHFTVRIRAQAFAGVSRIGAHRMVYKVLDDLIGPEIHALTIDATGPED